MELILRFLGLQFTVTLGPIEYEEPGERLSTSDHSFGFAPDPVFPELDWGEEE